MRRREEGAVAVEGVIMMTFMIFFLVFLMAFGFLFYQQWNIVFTANDTATRLAQSYAYPAADPIQGYISSGMKSSLSPFRYFGTKLEKANAEKGEKYASWSISQGSLAYAVGEPEIVIETAHDGFAQRHIVVDITATYEIPFGGALKFFGMDGTITYHATGRAVCTDLSDYVFSINTLKTFASNNLGSDVYGAIDSILGLINTIRENLED